MRLSVDHVTRYRFDAPVRGAVQSHRLMPSEYHGQRVLDWQVEVAGGSRGGHFRDGAGDRIQGWTIPGPLAEIVVTVQGTVETVDLAGVLRGHRETVVPDAYLRDTPLTAASVALADLAAAAQEADILSLAHALAGAVTAAIAYVPGATEAQTTAAEALAKGEGVCQDHAHALIACARLRAIPARYVSGYLFAGSDGPPPQAAHAWAELHVAGLGWVGFDPANACCPDARYIRIGSGFDAQDAAFIRGVARGAAAAEGGESLEVAVAVRAAEQ